MNSKDEKNTEKTMFSFRDIVRVFSSFSVSPSKALRKKNGELSFVSFVFPAFTYIFFAIQLVLDRFSFVPTMSGIKALLTVFISLIVGCVMGLISSGLLYSVLNLKAIKSDFQCILLCSNLSYIIPFIVTLIGLFVRLIFNAPTTITFGISGLLFMLIPYGRLVKELLKNEILWYIFVVAANGILSVFAVNMILFSVN